MSEPLFEKLRAESGGGEVGPLLYAEIRDVAERVARRYPPIVYSPNRQERWDDDAVLEVVHECLLRQMRRDQVRLLFGYARSLDALRGMIGKRLRQTLLDLRVTDVVDNLCRKLGPVLVAHTGVAERHGALVLGDATPRAPTEAELAAVARKISLVPQLEEQPAARAPRVYGPSALKDIAGILLSGLPGSVRTNAVDRVLRQVLTHRTVVALVPEVEAASVTNGYADPVVEDEVNTLVDAVVGTLSADQRALVRQVLEGWTDGEIAEARGCSRPTAHAARTSVTALLRPVLAEVDPELADHLASRLYERLSHER